VSRGGFRTRVGAPRPASAWAMVSVASATLWITQQLDLWAVVAQASALLFSLSRRTDPAAWQRSPIVLNLGMAAISAATALVALRGEPSTIALAHFAALTQGLQLLDARPRRAEFLLVALALFQVVLAANLTDSVFFTPLLIAFVFATVWTLLIHTLRSEALEAGELSELSRAITPGLLRTTILASGLSVLLAMLLFVALPRLRSSLFRGAQDGHATATAGFSDTVAFGEIGRIRQDPGVVLRVTTLEGDAPNVRAAYWRGLAFDKFDGTAWSVTPSARYRVAGSAEAGVELEPGPQRADLVQQIVREPVAAGVLFAAGEPRELDGTVRRLERDLSGGLYAAGQADERIRYRVRTRISLPSETALRRDRALPPARRGARYLQLPALSGAVAQLAREVTRDATTDADRVRALESYLREHGRYTDTPPAPDVGDDRTPVEAFLLGERAGHCEYFASAMVLMARSLGIPARLVNGFAGGRENRIGGFVELAHSDAHAWVEVHYAQAGWVRYDPTPPDLRLRFQADLPFGAQLRELGSALELWWFQDVVGFDRSDQIRAMKHAWFAWQRRADSAPARANLEPAWRLPTHVPWRDGVLLLTAAGLCAGLLRFGARARQRAALPRAYAAALHALARRGLVRAPAATARSFAAEAGTRLPPPSALAFAKLTEAYLASRFGGRPMRAEAADWLASVRDGTRAAQRRR
jgi:protein-glutamine gamma-glutamyltransferase